MGLYNVSCVLQLRVTNTKTNTRPIKCIDTNLQILSKLEKETAPLQRYLGGGNKKTKNDTRNEIKLFQKLCKPLFVICCQLERVARESAKSSTTSWNLVVEDMKGGGKSKKNKKGDKSKDEGEVMDVDSNVSGPQRAKYCIARLVLKSNDIQVPGMPRFRHFS